MKSPQDLMRDIGSRLGLGASSPPVPPKRVRSGDRNDTIAALRAEISRLQQELIALNADGTDEAPAGAKTGANKSLAAIEQRLSDTQRELATYQARI